MTDHEALITHAANHTMARDKAVGTLRTIDWMDITDASRDDMLEGWITTHAYDVRVTDGVLRRDAAAALVAASLAWLAVIIRDQEEDGQ